MFGKDVVHAGLLCSCNVVLNDFVMGLASGKCCVKVLLRSSISMSKNLLRSLTAKIATLPACFWTNMAGMYAKEIA